MISLGPLKDWADAGGAITKSGNAAAIASNSRHRRRCRHRCREEEDSDDMLIIDNIG